VSDELRKSRDTICNATTAAPALHLGYVEIEGGKHGEGFDEGVRNVAQGNGNGDLVGGEG
jgi:hypothetical protein